jgi:hypothetical protein
MPRMVDNAKETSRMSSSTREIMEMLVKVKKLQRCWDFFKTTMKGCCKHVKDVKQCQKVNWKVCDLKTV